MKNTNLSKIKLKESKFMDLNCKQIKTKKIHEILMKVWIAMTMEINYFLKNQLKFLKSIQIQIKLKSN